MTCVIGTISMYIKSRPTLVALRYYIFTYFFCSSFVKNKILTYKFIVNTIIFIYLTNIIDNTSMKLTYIIKAMIF